MHQCEHGLLGIQLDYLPVPNCIQKQVKMKFKFGAIFLVATVVVSCQSLALPDTNPNSCFCTCADGKKCIIAPGSILAWS